MSKISRSNVSDEVARWLTGAIQLGRFKPGERLPSVAQLAKELGGGQSTVREAMRHQQALGVLQMHQGKGTLVATPGPIELGSYVTSFSSVIREQGMTPGAHLLRGEVTLPDDEVKASLALDEGE